MSRAETKAIVEWTDRAVSGRGDHGDRPARQIAQRAKSSSAQNRPARQIVQRAKSSSAPKKTGR
jgi:hypothetical protein